MDCSAVVTACYKRLCLAGNTYLLCLFKAEPIQLTVIYRTSVHIAYYTALAKFAYTLFTVIARKVAGCGGFKDNSIIRLYRISGNLCASRTYFLLHSKHAGNVIRQILIQYIYHNGTAYPVVKRFLTQIAVAKLGIIASEICTVTERNVFSASAFDEALMSIVSVSSFTGSSRSLGDC